MADPRPPLPRYWDQTVPKRGFLLRPREVVAYDGFGLINGDARRHRNPWHGLSMESAFSRELEELRFVERNARMAFDFLEMPRLRRSSFCPG